MGRPFFAIIVLWLVTITSSLAAPLITELQRFNFGTIALSSNATTSRFNYPKSGSNPSIEGQFVLIGSGTPGRFAFSDFPANTTLTVTLSNTSLSASGVGISEALSVDNYDFVDITTDPNGDAELIFGARLNSSGNGNSYADAGYEGTTQLRVDYWQPDQEAFVFNTQIIDLEVELSSTLALNQEQQLDFGMLFARTSNIEQAVLTLSPSGSYTTSEPGNTRLVSITRPTPGIIRVSGAAAYYNLSITPQAGDILLEHTISPGSSPHLILNTLVTSPSGTGTTDANGELLIRIGGSLSTELTASPETYPSGQYEGIYQLTVSY